MNLEGKTVKFYFTDVSSTNEEKALNNNQETCPALVLTDWSPNIDNLTDKCLNLRIFRDCGTVCNEDIKTSILHVSTAGFYPKESEDEIDVIAKKDHWEMY